MIRLTPTTYRIISKNSNTIKVMRDAKRVTDFVLARYQMGKSLTAYIVIKSDNKGDRIISIVKSDPAIMEKTIEAA